MQVAATTHTDLAVWFSLLIGIGIGMGIPFVGLWYALCLQYVDSWAEVVSEAPAIEVWSCNADSMADILFEGFGGSSFGQ